MPLLSVAALVGFLAVALGAFGAHALKDYLTGPAEGWWQTATLYALTHSAAALAIGLSGRSGLIAGGGWALVLGVLIFSGSLYAMALGGPRVLGAVTPVGGLSFLAGWAMIGFAGLRG